MPGPERLFRWLSAALLIAVLGLVLATFGDYGMSADEPARNRYGNRLARWYQTLGADSGAVDQGDDRYQGGLFELCVQAARAVSPFGVYETRHLVSALFAVLGLAASWWTAAQLSGAAGGLLAMAVLAATPTYYGLAFAGGAEVPLAALYALAAAALLNVGLDALPGPGWRVLVRLLAAGTAIGLAAGVHVAALSLLALAAIAWVLCLWAGRSGARFPSRPLWRDLGRIGLDLGIVGSTAWLVMVLFWPFAQLDPFGNPFAAVQAAVAPAPPLFDGRDLAGALSRLHVPARFALTLPATYLVAAAMGAWRIAAVVRRKPLPAETWTKLSHFGWLLSASALPLVWAVVAGAPLAHGERQLLFVVPPLAALAGASAAWWLRGPLAAAVRVAGGLLLAAALGVVVKDMVELHPYQTAYYNRLVAGGLARAGPRYGADAADTPFAEGLRWIVGEYSSAATSAPVRVAGGADRAQLAYYLGATPQRRARFAAVGRGEDPHLVLASTTPRREDEPTPGRLVHVVARQGWPLLKVFERRSPLEPRPPR